MASQPIENALSERPSMTSGRPEALEGRSESNGPYARLRRTFQIHVPDRREHDSPGEIPRPLSAIIPRPVARRFAVQSTATSPDHAAGHFAASPRTLWSTLVVLHTTGD